MIRMKHCKVAKKTVESKIEGRRKVGSLRLRWLEEVENRLN
jgi:hypothetical protein